MRYSEFSAQQNNSTLSSVELKSQPMYRIYASTPRRQVDDEAKRTFEEDDIFEDNGVSDLKFTFSPPVNTTVEQKIANEEVKMPPIVENENGITSPSDETVSTTQIEFQRQKSTSSEQERKARQRRLQMPLMYRMYESVSEDVRGTIRGPCEENFRPEEASKTLRQALSGIQTDDKAMINILLAHTNFQRQKIVAAYTGMFHRNLADDIEEEAGGFFLDATLALLQPAHVYSARILHHALSGRSASRTIAVEIGLTSSASQLKVIRDAYFNEYHVSLEKDLSLKVEGVFGKMLQLILLRTRDSDAEIDMEQTDNLVEEMIKIEIDDLGRNLELFQKFFASQSMSQIRVFLDRYDARISSTKVSNETISESSKNRDFESIIRKSVNIHSEVRQLLLMYSKIARNMQLYFAEQLHQAISGTRPVHGAIIRILVMRSEIDLHDICDEYKRKYGKHLVTDLQMTCSGEFLRLLNLLINPVENGDDVFD
ncbi:Annexin A11 [Aphelenchoides besseyi]|nr:Annexin A11 [Aphelenchoides besseyi]KAI6200079.1 Annexin A11 [Aphelenchoides besseyi]